MKTNLSRLGPLLALLVALLTPCFAADAKADLQALVTKVRAKIAQGDTTEAALRPELAEFDTLLARYQGEKTDDVAQILVMKATLYAQIIKDPAKALALLQQLKKDFAGTKPGASADNMIAAMKRQEEADQLQSALAIGLKFPDFAEPDVNGRTVSLADYKGKVVLIDYWATWCGPCIAELPHVLQAYEKHHANGFEIIGISLDRADARQKLISFTQERKMPWAQIYDGQYWQTKLAVKYGINSIPATYLLDREGKIVAKNLRGAALEREVAKLIAAK